MKFVVLGGYGIIGSSVVRDLVTFAPNAEIVVAGRNEEKARDFVRSLTSKRLKSGVFDVQKEKSLVAICRGADVVINCVQYYYNLEIMNACIKAQSHYVDLGGMFHHTKKQLKLHEQFRKIGKTAILGIGAAPGISNLLSAYGTAFVKKAKSVEIIFADKDETVYKQKFVLPYSFKTLVDEFTLKPAVFRNGKTLFVQPRSGMKEYDFGPVFGKQEGFLTLHSEIATLPTSLRSKGIESCEFRVTFPKQFREQIETLISLGFTSQKLMQIHGKQLKMIDICSGIMDRLLPAEGLKIRDQEVVRVIINHGEVVLDALTKSDGTTPAGVLDTAVPCSIAAQELARGTVVKEGVYAPEQALDIEHFFRELRKRGIVVSRNGGEVRL